ncbi:MAG: nitroreductase [Promethearchaeota archaeon CR_4]|nr:MAG: nitroreductase [Candidatus Lokiarchaeota archaeon CR_4]
MSFIINQELCIQCGQCEPDCPALAISHEETTKKYEINQKRCIMCSHCACICPMAAVEDGKEFFLDWKDPACDPESLHIFLAGKRSVRQFHDREVPREILEKMLELGSYTGTASNAQDWHATIVVSPEKKTILRQGVQKMQAQLCKAIKNKGIRILAKLIPAAKAYLDDPNIMDKLQALEEELHSDHDRVFYQAPVVVILSTTKDSPFGAANCILAGSAMMYVLQARGIGSCYIGFAEQMLNRSKSICMQVGVPQGHKIHMVFALGYTKVKYQRLPHRKKMPVQFV